MSVRPHPTNPPRHSPLAFFSSLFWALLHQSEAHLVSFQSLPHSLCVYPGWHPERFLNPSTFSPLTPVESALTADHRVLTEISRDCPSVSPLESALTRNRAVTSLESALTKKTRGWGGAMLTRSPAIQGERKELAVHGGIVGKFGMERRSHDASLLHQRGLAGVFGQHFDSWRHTVNDRPADEHHLQRFALELARSEEDITRELAPVSVPQNRHIKNPQRVLRRVFHVRGQQNGSGAGAEDGVAVSGKFLDGHSKPFFLEELQLRSRFAARKNQPVAPGQIRRRAHLDGVRTQLLQHRGVRGKIALHRQYPDFKFAGHYCGVRHLDAAFPAATNVTSRRPVVGDETREGIAFQRHQPRVESMSFSSSWRTSMPGMASPSSSQASRTAFASSKCVLALTMALARASGSLDLKMPEPTKTASAPRRRTRAASAGVAMPPAEKLGTGSLPVLAIWRIRSSGAPISLASCMSSSSRSMVSLRMWLTMARMWRTASTTLPEPASPLVRIIAAPSAMRRTASPRLRAPQTNGTR